MLCRSLLSLCACVCAALALCAAAPALASSDTLLLGARYPALSPNGATIAFEYWGDIWLAPVDGGAPARRLTDHLAWDALPRFSPDGSSIAFVSDRSGNQDIWIIPAAGGAARQVTDFSGSDTLDSWSPDGEELIFHSSRGLWGSDLFTIAADGSAPARQLTRLDHYNSVDGARLPDGGYVYARGTGVWWRKNYRGTAQYDLWRIFPDGHRERLTDFNGQDQWPTLPAAGWTVYFVSSEDGIDNLYALDVQTGKREQLTHHREDGVQFPCVAADGKRIAYEWNGKLYTVPTRGGTPQPLALSLAGESKNNWQAKQSFSNSAGEFAVSPNGKYAVFVYAGDLWGIKDPKAYKDEEKPDQDLARAWRLTTTDGARERMPAFASDNHRVAYISDADGDYEIMLLDLADMSVKQLTQNDFDDVAPQFQPAEPNVLFYYSGNRKLVRSELGPEGITATTKVADGRFRQTFYYSGYAVSPDGKWVAYVDELDDWSQEVLLVDSLGQQPPVNISRDPEYDGDPQWSANGKWLLFNSGRDSGRSGRGGNQWYAVELNPEGEKYDLQFLFKDDQPKPPTPPAEPAAPAENGKAAAPAEAPKEVKKAESAPKNGVEVVIDFTDINLRARRVTSQPGTGSAVISDDGKWVIYECNPENNGNQIWAVKLKGGENKRINGGGWSSPELADSGKRIYYRDGGTLRYMRYNDGNNQGVESMDAHGEFTLDLRQRYRQMYREGWRTLKEMFYDKDMHGADWDAMYTKYLPLIEAAGTPEEFGLTFSELLGELNASHMGINMAASSYHGSSQTTCHPGLEFDPAYSGPGLRVAHVTYQGPADAPGVDIQPGDVLLQIEGQDVACTQDWPQLLDDKQGLPVRFTFQARAGAEPQSPRGVVLKPIPYGDYQELLYREWEKGNEDRVAELSHGRIGYIHIRGMNGGELRKFERELFSEVYDKDALIVDVRFNPGGFIHEQLFDFLDRNPFGYSAQRDAPQVLQPPRIFNKPKALLINARSGSDAEIFPAGWRELKLGPIIGVDTSGAVIGTSGFELIDGTTVRLPMEGWWTLEQRNLERSGTPPDINVEVTPDELAAGKDAQLEKAVVVLLDELDRQRAKAE